MKRLIAALAASVFVVSGCGSAGSSGSAGGHDGHGMAGPSSTASGHNAADVMFAKMMIPHHRQAVEMAELADGTAGPQVTKLAAAIKKAQGPEITEMSGWLKAWGEPVPSDGGTEHGMSHGDGMMSDADMKKLRGMSGAAFDRMFLTMMIKHHQGAVAMAKTERAGGAYPAAKSLASSIITTQNAEIAKMRTMLTSG